MNVEEIMTRPPITVDGDTAVDQVAAIMAEHKISGVPVLDQNGELLGMITEEDLIVRNARLHLPTFLTLLDSVIPIRGRHEFDEQVRHTLATRAVEVMSERLYTVTPATDVADAASLMVERHANPLPVVEQGRLVGVVSRADIIGLMIRESAGSA